MKGICPQCQTEVQVARDGSLCLRHNVCNKETGMPICEGSYNTAPECITDRTSTSFKFKGQRVYR